MTISLLARSIAESPTLKMNEEARLLRERGEAVIHLGIGEPKNKTPFPALLSAAAKLNSGDIKYSPTDGLPTLKKAIVRYTEDNYDRLVAPENIIVSSGAKQSLFNIFYALLDPNDEVIINAPYWVSYPEMVKMVRGVPVIVTPEDGGFYPRLADIERAVSSSTKAIVLNSPNNPSGVMYTDEFMAEIVAFCEKKNIYLIMDDIYHKLVFNRRKWTPAYKFTDQDVESSKLVVVNGIAKAYGMTGFRIGWCIANRRLVEVMTNIQSQITSCTAMVSQAAAEGALNGLQSVVESLRLTIENNREVMLNEPRRVHRRAVRAARWHLLLPAGLPRLHQQLGRAGGFPAEEGARRDRARQGIRHGRPPAPELRRDCEGRDRRRRPHPLGARSQRAERDLPRRPQAGARLDVTR